MKRHGLAAVVLAVLVATSVPFAAGDAALDLASIHNTDTDFNAGSLTNVTVSGSGTSAEVVIDATNDYNVIDDTGDGGRDTTANFIGDTFGDSEIDSEWKVKPNYNGDVDTINVSVDSTSGSDYGATVDVYAVQENPDGTVGEGTLVKSNWDPDWSTGTQSISLDTSFAVTAGQNWTIEFDINGSDTDGTEDRLLLDADSGLSNYQWDSIGGFSNTGGDITLSGKRDGGTGTYVSANHTVDRIEQGFTDLTLQNANATVDWQYWDGSSWTTIDSSTYTTSGNKSVSWSTPGASQGKWRVNVTFGILSGTTTASLDAEGVEFDEATPSIDNGSASPSGATKITNQQVTLSLDVDDTDFATGQSDSVDVDFYFKENSSSSYSQVGTDTLSSNGTASTTHTPSVGGSHKWYAVATDSYGASSTSQNFTFSSPSILYIRNETNTSELIDNPINVTVRFYGTDEVFTRSTNSGKVNMSGVPNQEFIVQVDASAQYYSRTIYINSIYQQQSVYLLNNTLTSVESRFQLEDPTGEYGPESILILQKAMNQSGNVTYRTIVSDKFGVEGVTTNLEKGERYRVRIRGTDGDVQDIGPYRADIGETVTVRPGSPTIEFGNYTDGWAANASINNDTITYGYSDVENETTSLKVYVHEHNNTSNILGTNRTYSNLGNATGAYSLTANQTNKTWVVNFEITRGGETFTKQITASNRPDLVPDIDREWRLIAAVLALFISAGLFSMLNAGVGGVVVALEGGVLWWTGWLEGATMGAAVVIALLISVMVHIYQSESP